MYDTSAGSGSIDATEQFSYDGDLRPQTDTATWGAGSGQSGQIFSESRWYDFAGNVVSLATTQAAVPGQSGSGGSETENYCYNEQDELVWASNASNPSPTSTETCDSQTPGNSLNGASYTTSYVYTNLGQLWQGPVAGGVTTEQYLYCNTAPHQLSGVYASGSACTNKSGMAYKVSGYDAFGNVTGRSYNGTSETLAYDELDRMVKWTVNAGNNDYFAYDASGNRTVQRATSSGTTTLTAYAFGLEEYQYSGTGTLQDATHYYSLGGRLIGALTGLNTPVTVFYLSDALGNLLATFNNTQGAAAIQGNQVYGPYGNSLYSSGSMDTAKGYTGQYADTLTGLDYYVSRYYDPVVGIFLSPDIIQGNIVGMNPYAYVDGNPETDTDPTGQYYSNGTQLGEQGGETAYVYNDEVVTATNTGVGRFTSLSGYSSWNYGSLNVNVSTNDQFVKYSDYNSANDPQYSTGAKFAAVTGWTQLQQSWNAPGATTQSRLMALLHFGETNGNNVLQLAMIMGGGDDEGVAAGVDALSAADKGALIKELISNPFDYCTLGWRNQLEKPICCYVNVQ
jgi:RHS repeat-associated protein